MGVGDHDERANTELMCRGTAYFSLLISLFEPSSFIPYSFGQLDKADVLPMPDACFLAVQCLSLALPQPRRIHDSLYNTHAIQHSPTGSPEPVCAPDPLKPLTLPSSEPACMACR